MTTDTVAERGPDLSDPRVRRTRAALMGAAVSLVSERGTTEVSVGDIVTAADASRRVFYQHFRNTNELLVAACLDLLSTSLGDLIDPESAQLDAANGAASLTTMQPAIAHLADHHRFYRSLLTGSCAFLAHEAVCEFFRPASAAAAIGQFGASAQTRREVADYFTDATTTAATRWLIDSRPRRPDPTVFLERLVRIQSVITGPQATDKTDKKG